MEDLRDRVSRVIAEQFHVASERITRRPPWTRISEPPASTGSRW